MRFSTYLFIITFLFFSNQFYGGSKSASPEKNLKDGIIKELTDAEEKITSLTNDIPQAKFTWRPEEGVRSVSEVVLHVAGANYFFLTLIGIKPPEAVKMDNDMDKKTTKKEEILEILKKSFAFTKEKINSLKEKDFDKMIDFFGNKLTERELLIKLATHSHEHLGQLIAYARMNGIMPAWSKK